MKIKNVSSGFTLFETMIVMSITALLISLGIFTYVQSAKTSRDAARKADLQTISNALEKYKSDNGTYPRVKYYANLNDYLINYLSNIPQDPKNIGDYKYVYEQQPSDCDSHDPPIPCINYILKAKLEIDGSFYEIDKYEIR